MGKKARRTARSRQPAGQPTAPDRAASRPRRAEPAGDGAPAQPARAPAGAVFTGGPAIDTANVRESSLRRAGADQGGLSLFAAAGGLLAELVQVPGGMSEKGLLAAAADRLREVCDQIPHGNFPEATDPATLTSLERLAWLTPREREVLFLFLDSANAKKVACRLGTSRHTVKHQLRAIERKLGATSRAALLAHVLALLAGFAQGRTEHTFMAQRAMDSLVPPDQ